MNSVVDAALVALLALVFVPVTTLLIEVVSAIVPRRPHRLPDVERPLTAVLVPAHDESADIGRTLEAISGQLSEGDRLIVIADNCTDDTAGVAAACGAEVIQRHDPRRFGKGYALDFGVQYLVRDLPAQAADVVIVVDADCRPAAGCLDRIARLSASTKRPVQALYLMKARSATLKGSIDEFAWIVKNQVRPLGMLRLGLPCQLMGTGMAFPWDVLRTMDLATGHLVEDLKLGMDFARAGSPPLFCPEALVTSEFAASEEGARNQRTRWEHGHLGMIVAEAPAAFRDGLRRMDGRVTALALDMCVPPLALLALVSAALIGLCAINSLLGGSALPLVAAILLFLMFGLAIGLSWWRFARQAITPAGLVQLFPYLFRKIPLYLMFAVRRQKKWIRSERDAD